MFLSNLLDMQLFFLSEKLSCQCLGYQTISFSVLVVYQMHFENEFYAHLNLHNNILLIDT